MSHRRLQTSYRWVTDDCRIVTSKSQTATDKSQTTTDKSQASPKQLQTSHRRLQQIILKVFLNTFVKNYFQNRHGFQMPLWKGGFLLKKGKSKTWCLDNSMSGHPGHVTLMCQISLKFWPMIDTDEIRKSWKFHDHGSYGSRFIAFRNFAQLRLPGLKCAILNLHFI